MSDFLTEKLCETSRILRASAVKNEDIRKNLDDD